MKIALIGCGYLGKIHAKCIKEITNLELVGVYDMAQDVAQETAERFSTVAYADMQTLIARCDVADIVTTTVTHFEVAKKSITSGKHCFIEKPVTATVEEAEQLIELAQKHNVAVQVGHVERYNPAFLAALPYLTHPLSIETFRLGKFNLRGADVSVVHDLMIHDIDLVLSLMKSDVIDIQAAGHQYISSSLDIANARLLFANGGIASLSASRIAEHPVRKMCIFQPENYITVNFQEKKVEKMEFKNHQTDISEISVVEHNAIVEELTDFIQTIQHQKTPKVTMNDGVNALRIADKVVKKILQ
ncbi:MAG: Gfo/Idh/MocA family oxidoreductase [Bacteroidetes bacterium]|nr:Gfo/Idh/MocA family oxidoreductase [Bacteroidota bacterium]MCL1968178.1 Gfo/Idh/MocA family oxidoreductase [Bacteroidota bacterium]MCL1968545.1 Gfo/Idh/MocA family oxidoreductase [Bacteroidota bacterium]